MDLIARRLECYLNFKTDTTFTCTCLYKKYRRTDTDFLQHRLKNISKYIFLQALWSCLPKYGQRLIDGKYTCETTFQMVTLLDQVYRFQHTHNIRCV